MSTIVNVTEDELLLSSVKPAYYPDAVMISVLTAVALVPNGAVLFYVFVRRQKLLKNLETRNIRVSVDERFIGEEVEYETLQMCRNVSQTVIEKRNCV
ncbi:hypothetical protein L596_017945 [Steinernema carpocapsae]|uniref:Uncharacterized protein n=1 Tax=Steinernema carpocapsae TaxID=34508 RepID=A0A4U5N3J9_STECR|nr:hypothetical protein L596_017945 [Steinernema carpocapsae]